MLKNNLMTLWNWILEEKDNGLACEAFYKNVSGQRLVQTLNVMRKEGKILSISVIDKSKSQKINLSFENLIDDIQKKELTSFIALFSNILEGKQIEWQFMSEAAGLTDTDTLFDLEVLWWPYKVFGNVFDESYFKEFKIIIQYLIEIKNRLNAEKFFLGLEQSMKPQNDTSSWIDFSSYCED